MSKESTEQGKSGRAGSEAEQTPGEGGQPRQGSSRTEARKAEQEPKHHFAKGQAPSEQGEKEHPSPHVIAEHQQGFAGSGSGHHGNKGADTEKSEEIAGSGEPYHDHTRHGRENLSGDRPRDDS